MFQMTRKSPVGNWLDKKFVEWQMEEGGRRTIADFVEYLEISRATFDKWSRGERTPEKQYADLLADKLEDDTIYDVLGLEKPDSAIRIIKNVLANLTEPERKKLVETAQNMAGKKKKGQPTDGSA